jgi:serine/threonine-protein phosphatase 2A regulatory subunit B'
LISTPAGLAQNVLKMYMEYDMALYDRCSSDYLRLEEEKKRKAQDAERRYEHTYT